MNDAPLYNSRITKSYIEYIHQYYPDIDINEILNYAGISPSEVDDEGHWFTQKQVDRCHQILVQKTGNPDISRAVGRFSATARAATLLQQYARCFITPEAVYSRLGDLSEKVSRGAAVSSRRIGPNKVEVIAVPKPGVEEKPFQCENRMGIYEAVAKLFTADYAHIEHPVCCHRGGDRCEYIISWEKTPALRLRQARNYTAGAAAILCSVLFYFLPPTSWAALLSLSIVLILVLSFYAEFLDRKNIIDRLGSQGEMAERLLNQINLRHNETALVQEIGQAASMIPDIGKLLGIVMETLKKRLDFDRGMIMLVDPDYTRLVYKVSYGYVPVDGGYLENVVFHLNNPQSRGAAVEAFRKQIPILVNDLSEIEGNTSPRSLEFIHRVGTKSFICVPITYKGESLGVLMVDNIESKRRLDQADINLLMGIAPQIGISINNAISYQKIRESEERFRSLNENAPDIIFTLGLDGTFSYANPAFERILGYRPDEIVGKRFIDFARPEDAPDYLYYFERIYREKTTIRNEVRILLHRSGGEKYFRISVSPNLGSDGNIIGVVGLCRDITDQHNLEMQLLHAQKMEAVGTLAGGIAHDFNNLLMGIQGYASLMLLDLDVSHPHYGRLRSIEQQVHSGAHLTRQLLGFARGGRYEVKPTDLNEVIEKTSTMFGRAKKELTIHHHFERQLWTVEADRGQIEQALLNLYVNAWQAMPGGGELYLETHNVTLDENYTRPFSIQPGRYVKITVTDTGVGMDEKTRERIFEPFFTTKEMGRGTGLGLATVYGIIKGHRGLINVYSEKGQGTTFTIYFPSSEKKVAGETQVQESPVGGKETVLIIDDEDVILDVTKELVESLGYQVLTARGGEEAIEIYKVHKDRIDLLILDMIMPGLSGGETFERLREIRPEVKVILSSGYSLNKQAIQIMERGCQAFIQKPFSRNGLSQKIREVLDRK